MREVTRSRSPLTAFTQVPRVRGRPSPLLSLTQWAHAALDVKRKRGGNPIIFYSTTAACGTPNITPTDGITPETFFER